MEQGDFVGDKALMWLLRGLGVYLRNAFFFNPFRHSVSRLGVKQTEKLTQDGSNLAQVLHTINSNDRELFAMIEKLVHAALPDIGRLQFPLFDTQTEVHFRASEGYTARLHDMGGGIEQLMMIATVLLTTSATHALFVEEPESHLHSAAQRFLMERLAEGGRQVFITTHAPAFINSPREKSIYQVKYRSNRTEILSDDECRFAE
jgi:predicted ATPase